MVYIDCVFIFAFRRAARDRSSSAPIRRYMLLLTDAIKCGQNKSEILAVARQSHARLLIILECGRCSATCARLQSVPKMNTILRSIWCCINARKNKERLEMQCILWSLAASEFGDYVSLNYIQPKDLICDAVLDLYTGNILSVAHCWVLQKICVLPRVAAEKAVLVSRLNNSTASTAT